MGDKVTVVDRHGLGTTDIDSDQLGEYQRNGYRVQSADEHANIVGEDARNADTSAVEAFGQGVGRTASFGASDAIQRAIGGEDARRYLNRLDTAHHLATVAGGVAGIVATGGEGLLSKTGDAAAEMFGGGIAGGIARGVTEGSAYGFGNGVSDLALSSDPLTAERIASTLSSNTLLGGVAGGVLHGSFKAVERGLGRAGTALSEGAAARSALDAVPGDLASLDEKGLAEASKAAKAEHVADIAAERQSLEGLRVDKRAELANQIRDLHTDLATERPIYQAVAGDDLAKIEGVNDIKVQLAKSFKSMRSGLDSEISVARDPGSLVRPLEMRQAALEKLQAKAPEIRIALGDDTRVAALDHVDDALAETKQQIQDIGALSKSTPVASGRLTMLEAGGSPRMQAIDAAREALRNGPEIGLVQKGAQAGAFAGGTALAHMIPGVGMAAPFLGKGASDAVGKLFERLAGANKIVTDRSTAATKAFLETGEKLAPIVPSTATRTLASVRFAAGLPESKSSSLPDLFKARTDEIKTQTMYAPDGSVQMRPEARAALAAKLAPIGHVNPILADKIESVRARVLAFQSSKIPRQPDVGGIQIGPDNWQPSDMLMRSFARTIRASEDPLGVEERLASGMCTPEDAEAYRTCYPERFVQKQIEISQQLPLLAKSLPMAKKVSLSVFYGVPVTPLMTPNVMKVLQGNFATEPGSNGGTQAPAAQPNYGAMGSLKSVDKPSPAQAREG